MGYYTKYDMDMIDYEDKNRHGEMDEETVKEISEKLTTISGYSWDVYRTSIEASDEMKWYNYDADMLKLSLMYPKILFKLEGEGEEQGDHWKNYYMNGKSQETRAVITFDEFSFDKLR